MSGKIGGVGQPAFYGQGLPNLLGRSQNNEVSAMRTKLVLAWCLTCLG